MYGLYGTSHFSERNLYPKNGMHDKSIILSHDDNVSIPDFLSLILPILVDKGFDLKNGLNAIGWKS